MVLFQYPWPSSLEGVVAPRFRALRSAVSAASLTP